VPTGLFGGHQGHRLRLMKLDADGAERELDSKQTNFTMEPGSALRWEQACGGGYGDPLERDPELVLRDWLDEFITADMARDDYGVVIDVSAEAVDADATTRLRAERA
jgi:N-methylhydantoinase B/oxoprolinase/acetone carboxylase alpha subunit